MQSCYFKNIEMIFKFSKNENEYSFYTYNVYWFIFCPATFILSYFNQFVYYFGINYVDTKFANILWSVNQNELLNAPYN